MVLFSSGGDDAICDGGIPLALALWLRSEILLRSDKPRAALEDLKLALKERLPAKMRAQYYWRMGHCYKGKATVLVLMSFLCSKSVRTLSPSLPSSGLLRHCV